MLTVSVWVSPAATGEMVGNSLRPALIARALEKLLRDNRAVDTESLCIKFGEKVRRNYFLIFYLILCWKIIVIVYFSPTRLGF